MELNFKWDKIYKEEDRIFNEMIDIVESRIKVFYEVDSVLDLTAEQIDEFEDFINFNEDSIFFQAMELLWQAWHESNSESKEKEL